MNNKKFVFVVNPIDHFIDEYQVIVYAPGQEEAERRFFKMGEWGNNYLRIYMNEQKAQEANEEKDYKAAKFNIGDKVQIVDRTDINHQHPLNSIGVITHVFAQDLQVAYNNLLQTISPKDLQLVEKKETDETPNIEPIHIPHPQDIADNENDIDMETIADKLNEIIEHINRNGGGDGQT